MKIQLIFVVLVGLTVHINAQGFFNRFGNRQQPKPDTTDNKPDTGSSGTSGGTSGTDAEADSDFFSLNQNVERVKEFVKQIKPEVDTDDFSLDRNPEASEDADVLFILDRSFSVGEQAFEQAKCALRNWAYLLDENLDIRIRITILSFGRIVKLESKDFFESYRSLDDVIQAVNDVPYFQWTTGGLCPRRLTQWGSVEFDGCATCTNLALQVSEWLLLDSGKSRDTATKAIIMITDGRSNCPEGGTHTCDAAQILKDQGVDVFVHAVGRKIYEPEIKCIASPDNYNLNTDYEETCRVTEVARETGVSKK